MTRGFRFTLCLISLLNPVAWAAIQRTLPIIPRPSVERHLNGTFLVGRSAAVYADPQALPVANLFAEQLRREFGIAAEINPGPAPKKGFRFVTDPKLPDEGYRLRIDPRMVTIQGSPAGMFYGAQTIFQLAAAGSRPAFILPAEEIEDQPRFPYRGLHLDTSRHMFPVEFLKRYLDWMGRYKL